MARKLMRNDDYLNKFQTDPHKDLFLRAEDWWFCFLKFSVVEVSEKAKEYRTKRCNYPWEI
jgi:hypothetical protein